MHLAGIDFTCSPSRTKPITVAIGHLDSAGLHLDALDVLPTLARFDAWLREPGSWLAAFDFPFGLPREFVEANRLGATCAAVIASVHARCPSRMAWRAFIDAWGSGRPAGQRLLHRRTDTAGGAVSTSPLQTRYVPVGLMYYEGLARLVAAGAELPGLHAGDARRIALEGYPGRLAQALVGRRSYKNSPLEDRRVTREAILAALEAGAPCVGFAIRADDRALRESLLDDASGDRLDAVLCLVQATTASCRPRFGLPEDADPVEGWIVGA